VLNVVFPKEEKIFQSGFYWLWDSFSIINIYAPKIEIKNPIQEKFFFFKKKNESI
jgi:hypothetical protein